MAKCYIHTMSVYGMEQFCVCCYGNNFTTLLLFSTSVLLTASLNQSQLQGFNYLVMLCK